MIAVFIFVVLIATINGCNRRDAYKFIFRLGYYRNRITIIPYACSSMAECFRIKSPKANFLTSGIISVIDFTIEIVGIVILFIQISGIFRCLFARIDYK